MFIYASLILTPRYSLLRQREFRRYFLFTVTCKRRGGVQSILHRRKSARFSLFVTLAPLPCMHTAEFRVKSLLGCTKVRASLRATVTTSSFPRFILSS